MLEWIKAKLLGYREYTTDLSIAEEVARSSLEEMLRNQIEIMRETLPKEPDDNVNMEPGSTEAVARSEAAVLAKKIDRAESELSFEVEYGLSQMKQMLEPLSSDQPNLGEAQQRIRNYQRAFAEELNLLRKSWHSYTRALKFEAKMRDSADRARQANDKLSARYQQRFSDFNRFDTPQISLALSDETLVAFSAIRASNAETARQISKSILRRLNWRRFSLFLRFIRQIVVSHTLELVVMIGVFVFAFAELAGPLRLQQFWMWLVGSLAVAMLVHYVLAPKFTRFLSGWRRQIWWEHAFLLTLDSVGIRIETASARMFFARERHQ